VRVYVCERVRVCVRCCLIHTASGKTTSSILRLWTVCVWVSYYLNHSLWQDYQQYLETVDAYGWYLVSDEKKLVAYTRSVSLNPKP
jgi:hypothetical protein